MKNIGEQYQNRRSSLACAMKGELANHLAIMGLLCLNIVLDCGVDAGLDSLCDIKPKYKTTLPKKCAWYVRCQGID